MSDQKGSPDVKKAKRIIIHCLFSAMPWGHGVLRTAIVIEIME